MATETTTEATPAPVLLYPDRHGVAPSSTHRKVINTTKITLVVADLLMVATGLVLATWINARVNPTDPTTEASYMRLVLLSLPMWPIVITQQLLYRARYLGRVIDEISRVIRATEFSTVLMTSSMKAGLPRCFAAFETISDCCASMFLRS